MVSKRMSHSEILLEQTSFIEIFVSSKCKMCKAILKFELRRISLRCFSTAAFQDSLPFKFFRTNEILHALLGFNLSTQKNSFHMATNSRHLGCTRCLLILIEAF